MSAERTKRLVQFHLTESERDRLVLLAAKDQRTVASYMRALLARHFRELEEAARPHPRATGPQSRNL